MAMYWRVMVHQLRPAETHHYIKIVSLLKSSSESTTFLDLGTSLGKDVRALHYSGVPLTIVWDRRLARIRRRKLGSGMPTAENFIVCDIFDTEPETSGTGENSQLVERGHSNHVHASLQYDHHD
jgi:hypothetical protein